MSDSIEQEAWIAEREEAPGETRIEKLRWIVEHHSFRKVEGQVIDAQTANALVTVHDALSPENQAKFGDVPLLRLVDFAWKRVRVGGFTST